jgi:hypothetical protein
MRVDIGLHVYECKPVQGAGFELSTLAKFQFRDFSTELNSFLYFFYDQIEDYRKPGEALNTASPIDICRKPAKMRDKFALVRSLVSCWWSSVSRISVR